MPGSWPPNWLVGKPRIVKSDGVDEVDDVDDGSGGGCDDEALSVRMLWYSSSRPWNCGVKPHLEAVLTTRTTLPLCWERGYGLPFSTGRTCVRTLQ